MDDVARELGISKKTLYSFVESKDDLVSKVMDRHIAQQCKEDEALHAKSIGFTHPTTRKDVLFNSELADDMQQVIEKWRGYVKTKGIQES